MKTRHCLSRREFLKLGAAFAGATLTGCLRPLATFRPQPNGELDDFIRARMQTAHLPGLATCVVRNNLVVWANGYGWASVEDQTPVSPDTLFMLASTSKTVTAVSLMQLYDDGLFDLDSDVNGYLPFSVRNPNHPDTVITPRMLLTHTSSICDNWDVLEALYVTGDSSISLGDFCQGYLTPGGTYYDGDENFGPSPGTHYDYSNVGAALCGYLAEGLSSLSFEQHCQQRLFTPLGMHETSWHLAGLNVDHIAVPYTYDGGGYTPYEHYGYPDYPIEERLFAEAGNLGATIFLPIIQNDRVTLSPFSTVGLVAATCQEVRELYNRLGQCLG